MWVITCEMNTKGKVLTFCDHVSYCESKTVRRSVSNGRLLFSTIPSGNGEYDVRGLNCTQYMRQKCANSPLMYSFPLLLTKISGIPNLTIQ